MFGTIIAALGLLGVGLTCLYSVVDDANEFGVVARTALGVGGLVMCVACGLMLGRVIL